MKYKVLENNLAFIVDMNFEILSVIEKEAFPNSDWLSSHNVYYIDKIKQLININSLEAQNVIKMFKKTKIPNYGRLYSFCEYIDDNFNFYNNYMKMLKETKKKNMYTNKKNLLYFEKIIKEFFKSIDYQKIYNNLIKDYENYINEIKQWFCKDEYRDKIVNLYGKKLGDFVVICSFISGNFGGKDNGKIVFVRKFKILESNNIKLSMGNTLPFFFHEFSHPYISEIVSKYKKKLTNLKQLYNKLNLTNEMDPYKGASTFINEVLTRANEFYLTKEYLPEGSIVYIQRQINYGIYFFKDLVNIIETKMENYENYEQLFVKEIIPFINGL